MRWIDFENRAPTDGFPGWTPWAPERWQAWLATSQQYAAEMAALHAEAEALRQRGDAKGAAAKVAERNKVIDDHGQHWGALKEWMLALSHGKCWFSDTKDLFSHYEVEHFRPKKQAIDDETGERDGYWWLAFDYSNFRICGNVGNRKKGGWFPLQLGSRCSTYADRCEESEAPYLLDPTDPTDVEILAFDEEGKVIPAPGASGWQKERVEVSVERLKLDKHEPLVEARRAKWQEVTREIEGYLQAKQRSTRGTNPGAKRDLAGHIRKIRAAIEPDQALSSVARWCIAFRNDPVLLKLIA